jgi:hypothetical protein
LSALVASCGGNASSTTQPGDDATVEDSYAPPDTAPDTSVDSALDADTNTDASDAPDTACPSNQVMCPSGCANLQSDNANCGSCGVACTGGLVCAMGTCSPNCMSPQTLCPAPDAGPASDASDKDAGEAGASDASEAGTADASDSGTVDANEAGTADANEAGTADASDSGTADASGDGGPSTPTGAYCATLGTDPTNCGACGNACPSGGHSTPTCASSACGPTCDPHFADCDKDATNGCEVDTNSDVMNCGACGASCASWPNSKAACVAGACGLACNAPYADCDKVVTNGCEDNTSNDPANCGACGSACPSGPHSTPTCATSKCALQCDPAYADCDKNPSTGCEVHTSVDVNNCGACGYVCKTPNATPVCANSSCAIAQCNSGYYDCNGTVADGCEINTNTDPNNCGGCGIKCTIANGVGACVNGMCTVGICNAGWTDCDAKVATGCEVNTGADANNCGMCGNRCNLANATASCTAGVCGVAACNAGFTNCNNQPADGCEVHTSADVNNCGGCGIKCSVANGTAGCTNSVCSVAGCNSGWGDCLNGYTDGCETNTTTSNTNCGACGKSCATTCVGNVASTSCSASTCSVTSCSAGFNNNDGVCANGCECPSSTTINTCGGMNLGILNPGQAISAFKSNLMPVFSSPGVPNSAWFSITFNGNGNTAYHPKITLSDPANEFVMDVQTNCTGTMVSTCTDSPAGSKGVLTFETTYTGGDPTSTNINGVSNFTPITTTGTLYVHVYRRNPSAATTCNQYTLSASD